METTAAFSLVVYNVCMTQDARDISHMISFNIYNNSGEHSSLYFTEDKWKSRASERQTQDAHPGLTDHKGLILSDHIVLPRSHG